MFWLSVVLAIGIGAYTLLTGSVGVGSQIVALALAGNAFVRLQRGQPARSGLNSAATWVAIAISGAALAIGLYRTLQ